MSVNTWERDLSKVLFLWQSHLLNQYISYTFARMPAKYKNSYDAYVINKGFESFENLYEANRIIVNENTPDADFKERKKLLRKGIGLLNACASAAHIYMDHVRQADGINEDKVEKVKAEIGKQASTIEALVLGVIRSDEERQKKYKEKRSKKKSEIQKAN